MRLTSLNLNSLIAVKELLKKLSINSTTSDLLADHFLLASDGETYLVDDIKSLSQEAAAQDLAISFNTKDGQSLSLYDVYEALQNSNEAVLENLIYNKPLADMLVTRDSPLNALFFPIIFPVTSYLENTHEELEIKGFLDYCKKNELALCDPYLNKPLGSEQLIPNLALQRLIKFKIDYLIGLHQKKF